MKVLCIKNYILDGDLVFKSGVYYKLGKKHIIKRSWNGSETGYEMKGVGFKGIFWVSQTEYFDFKIIK